MRKSILFYLLFCFVYFPSNLHAKIELLEKWSYLGLSGSKINVVKIYHDQIYVGTDGGVHRYTDGTWVSLNQGLPEFSKRVNDLIFFQNKLFFASDYGVFV